MKKTMICTGMAPAVAVSDSPALKLLDPEGDVRVLLSGHSAVVLSSLKGAEWNRILQEYPALLEITDDRGQYVFSVGFDNSGSGSVSSEEVIFGNVVTLDGYATITILLDPDLEAGSDPLQVLKKFLSEGLNRLSEVEQTALAVLLREESRKRKIRYRILRL